MKKEKKCRHKKALEKSGITLPENYTCRKCKPSDSLKKLSEII